MKTLLIDLDGTVADTHGFAFERSLLRHEACTWNMTCCLQGLTMDELWAHTELFSHAPPIVGAVDGVALLAEHFDVHFVSTPWHRNHKSARAKYEWVEKYFDDPKMLTLTHHKHLIPAVALVDDKPGLVGPWDHVCYPQRWNDSEQPTWRKGLATVIIDKYKET